MPVLPFTKVGTAWRGLAASNSKSQGLQSHWCAVDSEHRQLQDSQRPQRGVPLRLLWCLFLGESHLRELPLVYITISTPAKILVIFGGAVQ